jgi:membrane protein implicated in regulation of membrane protease activity
MFSRHLGGRRDYPGGVLATTFTPGFLIGFSVFVLATLVLIVLTVRFVLRRERERRQRD